MTQIQYPGYIETVATKSIAVNVEENSGGLDIYLKCREKRIQAQIELLNSCKNDADVHRFNAKGLLNFEASTLY
jgi:hypothetical protein